MGSGRLVKVGANCPVIVKKLKAFSQRKGVIFDNIPTDVRLN